MNLNTNNLPQLFIELINKQYPIDSDRIFQGCVNKATSFRVNLLKTTPESVFKSFTEKNIELNYVNWATDIFYSNSEVSVIIETDEYRNGEIYLQSLSSCLPVLALDPKPNEDILDMTAAPGGKTTQIASLSSGKANITACERHPMRCEKLKYNLDKQGVKNVNVINKDARQLEDWFKFDKILLDAPCSGSGTLLQNNNNDYFSEKLISNTVKTQKALIDKALKLLKKNGILVYSTCSVLKQENEEIINKYIKNNVLEVVKIDTENITEVPVLPSKIDGTLTVCPNQYYEGFFVAVLKKN